MAYQCDTDDGAEAVFIMTNLTDGEGLALCGPHFAEWIKDSYVAMFGDPDAPVDLVPADPDTGDDTDEDEDADEDEDEVEGVAAPDDVHPDEVPAPTGQDSDRADGAYGTVPA